MAKHIYEFDITLLSIVIIISIIGIIVIYSATHTTPPGNKENFYLKQILWLTLSLIALIIVCYIPYNIYETFAYPIYIISIALLILVLLKSGTGQFIHRWFSFGPIKIQPSEIAKLATIFALARCLSGKKVKLMEIKDLVKPGIIAIIPFILILKQPDLGSSLVFIAITFAMLYWAGLSPIYTFFLITPIISAVSTSSFIGYLIFMLFLFALLYLFRINLIDVLIVSIGNLSIGIIAPSAWNKLLPYQQNRILAFFDPSKYHLEYGYQIIQSKVAIGSGGLWGKGFLQGTQKNLSFLPEQHTDFIFSVFGEEFGFAGGLLLLLLFLILIIKCISIAGNTKDKFGSLVAIGITSFLVFHIFINIGMTIGIMPVTGIPLPLVSYGGSSLFTIMISIGILLNIKMRKYRYAF